MQAIGSPYTDLLSALLLPLLYLPLVKVWRAINFSQHDPAGMPFKQLAAKWDELRGWQRGVIGLGFPAVLLPILTPQ